MNKLVRAIIGATAALFVGATQAAPIDVSYDVTGTNGNWTLNFTLTNNLNPDVMGINMFAIDVGTVTSSASPAHFDIQSGYVFSWGYELGNAGATDITTVYDTVWQTFVNTDLLPGQTLGGFKVTVTEFDAPLEVRWTGTGYSGWSGRNVPYESGPYIGFFANPGFQGVVSANSISVTSVPEPSTFLLAGLALAGLGIAKRRPPKAL